jgi:hypothetical protein
MEKMIDKGLALTTVNDIIGFIRVMTNFRNNNETLFMKILEETPQDKCFRLVHHIMPSFRQMQQQNFAQGFKIHQM